MISLQRVSSPARRKSFKHSTRTRLQFFLISIRQLPAKQAAWLQAGQQEARPLSSSSVLRNAILFLLCSARPVSISWFTIQWWRQQRSSASARSSSMSSWDLNQNWDQKSRFNANRQTRLNCCNLKSEIHQWCWRCMQAGRSASRPAGQWSDDAMAQFVRRGVQAAKSHTANLIGLCINCVLETMH